MPREGTLQTNKCILQKTKQKALPDRQDKEELCKGQIQPEHIFGTPVDFPSPLSPKFIESPISFEKSKGRVTNEKISLETKGEVSRLCSLTGTLQRKLELEYFPPKEETMEIQC